MFVEEQRAPICGLQMDVKKPPCDQEMFRIGTEANSAYVCPTCDMVSPEKALDSPGTSE